VAINGKMERRKASKMLPFIALHDTQTQNLKKNKNRITGEIADSDSDSDSVAICGGARELGKI
jgi:hypothetical protein